MQDRTLHSSLPTSLLCLLLSKQWYGDTAVLAVPCNYGLFSNPFNRISIVAVVDLIALFTRMQGLQPKENEPKKIKCDNNFHLSNRDKE